MIKQVDVGIVKSRINGFKKTINFGMKCLFKHNPFKLIAFLFFLMMLIFAIAMRIVEFDSSKFSKKNLRLK